jgi:iron(III) transport system substrate-binding protein
MTRGIARRTFLASSALALLPRAARAATPVLAERFADLYKAAAAEGEVVYYTSARTEEAKALSTVWKQTFPDVQLTLVTKSAPDLITQIEAEKAAGQNRLDVATITQPYVAVAWKAKGLFTPYRISSFDALGRYADPDAAYYTTGVYLTPAAYNPKILPDKTALPAALKDFLDPKWKSKLVLAHPATAGNTRTFFLGLLQAGKIDWTWIEALGKQDVLFVKGNPEAARIVAAGERPLSPVVSSLNILTSKQKGQAIDLYGLTDGTIVAERPSGIISNAPHPNGAKLVLEFIASAEGQDALGAAGMFWPTNKDSTPIPGLPPLADLKPISLDLKAIADDAKAKEFLTRFDQAFGRS